MSIHFDQTKVHWNYFLAIEQDFEKISRYIEFSELNNDTFSIELARIIMAATQEIDVIMKNICGLISEQSPNNVDQYREIIRENLSAMITETVYAPKYGMNSQPWINWLEDKNPNWWQANNKIKHQRIDFFHKANLKNAFNALGGLLVASFYYYKIEFEKQQGKEVEWKEITGRLGSNSSILSLNNDYYYKTMII